MSVADTTATAAILRALVESGEAKSGAYATSTKMLAVAVLKLRQAGFVVETVWGHGYRMSQAERVRLKHSDYYAKRLRTIGSRGVFIVHVHKNTADALLCEATERGVTVNTIANECFERGVDALLG